MKWELSYICKTPFATLEGLFYEYWGYLAFYKMFYLPFYIVEFCYLEDLILFNVVVLKNGLCINFLCYIAAAVRLVHPFVIIVCINGVLHMPLSVDRIVGYFSIIILPLCIWICA